MKRSLLILLLIFTLLSCGKNKRINLSTVISFDMKEKSLKLSELCDTITYLPLETKEESLLGLIQKMRFSNTGYYFLSGFNQEKIIGFDKKTGNHILTINKNGKGPGEYIRASDLFVDQNNNFIEIYSRGNKKIINYNIDGSFNHDKKVDQYLRSFLKINNDYYAEVEEGKNKKVITFFSENNNFTSSLFELQDYRIGDINNYSTFGDTVSFGCSINKFIYHLIKKEVYVMYELNFGKYNIPDKLLDQGFSDYQKLKKVLNDYDCAYNLFSTYESSNFLVTTVYFRKERHLAVYCKGTGHSAISNIIIDDINSINQKMKIVSGFLPIALDNNELIFTIEPPLYKDMINKQLLENSHKNKFINTSLINLMKTIKDIDNPILMSCMLKNF